MLDEIATATEEGGNPPPVREVFLPTENVTVAIPSNYNRQATIEEIEAACAECQAYNGGEGFFGRQWDNRVTQLLLPSYKLLCLINDDPIRLGIAIAQAELKTTKATQKNPPLICVNITAQPRDTAQRKLCSGWAEILNEALSIPVSVEDFEAWVMTRDKHRPRCNAANKGTEPSGSSSTNQLKLRLTGSDGPVDEILALPPLVHAELLDVLTTPCPQSERVQRVAKSLLLLAAELKMAEEGAKTAPASTDELEAGPTITEVADD